MLSLDTIAQIRINLTRTATAPKSYDTGLILYSSDGYTPAKRVRYYTSAEDMLTDGFTVQGEPYLAARKYFGVSPAPSLLTVSCRPLSETPAEGLTAVTEITTAFYGVYLCAGTDEQCLDLASLLVSLDRFMLFYPVVSSAAEATAPDALFARLKALGTRRALGILLNSREDAAAIMGVAMGLALSRADSSFALCYKTATGVEPVSMTQTQVDAVKTAGGNVYILRGYTRKMLENGATASGARYDEVLYLDMISSDIQETCVSLLADNISRLPQSDTTSALFINAVSAVLERYFDRGVLSSGEWRGRPVGALETGDTLEKGYYIHIDPYDIQPPADREAHKAMPLHVCLLLTGAVESVVITIDVQD